jgi:prophage regulatory protein
MDFTASTQRLLRLAEVVERTGLSRSSLYAAIQRGTFPGPVKIGPRSSAWPESEIVGWINDRISERDASR